MPRKKKSRVPSDPRASLAGDASRCLAADSVTGDGHVVGFMYREAPVHKLDSGWRFLSGTETKEYLDDPSHLNICDLKTIADHCPEIVPYLLSPVGSAFERDGESDDFTPVKFEPPP